MRKASVRDLRRDHYDRSQSQADIVVENMTPDGVPVLIDFGVTHSLLLSYVRVAAQRGELDAERHGGCIGASPRRQHLRQPEEQALQQDHHREEPRPQLRVVHRRVIRCVRHRHLEIH